jgi:hypothetical protein
MVGITRGDLKQFLRIRFPNAYRRLESLLGRRLRQRSVQDVFSEIYARNKWGSVETRSGQASTLASTVLVRDALPQLLRELGVHSLLDLPCGDFHWMKTLELDMDFYTGADIVPQLIAENQRRYGGSRRRFIMLDITQDLLPLADLLLCRDCLVHLSNEEALRAIENIRSSRMEYILMTTFPAQEQNDDILNGQWRPVNLRAAPFNFPPPRRLVNEGFMLYGGHYRDKSLGLWKLIDLN